MKSEMNLVNSSLGCIFTIDGSRTSIESLTMLTELFRDTEAWVCDAGRGLWACCGDTPGLLLRAGVLLPDCDWFREGIFAAAGIVVEDGDGGSSIRCRFRGAVVSSLASLPGGPF